jgi:mannose-6-phosphate isomerase
MTTSSAGGEGGGGRQDSGGGSGSEARMVAPEAQLRAAARGALSPTFAPVRVEKPWGYELIWAHTELYVGKILHIHAGEAFSLQFHEEKDETLHLLRGRVRLHVGPGVDSLEERILEEGDSVRIEPGTLHRMEALSEVDLMEVSTPELDDVVRIEDRYGRAG